MRLIKSSKGDATYTFNEGGSRIHLAFSPINQGWLVWRQDGDHQALVRIHNKLALAEEDFDGRVRFLEEMS